MIFFWGRRADVTFLFFFCCPPHGRESSNKTNPATAIVAVTHPPSRGLVCPAVFSGGWKRVALALVVLYVAGRSIQSLSCYINAYPPKPIQTFPNRTRLLAFPTLSSAIEVNGAQTISQWKV